MAVMTFTYGTISSYLANLEQILSKLKFKNTEVESAVLVLTAMVTGIFSSFIFIRKLKATMEYKRVIAFCTCAPT
jgi:hypothetical protein